MVCATSPIRWNCRVPTIAAGRTTTAGRCADTSNTNAEYRRSSDANIVRGHSPKRSTWTNIKWPSTKIFWTRWTCVTFKYVKNKVVDRIDSICLRWLLLILNFLVYCIVVDFFCCAQTYTYTHTIYIYRYVFFLKQFLTNFYFCFKIYFIFTYLYGIFEFYLLFNCYTYI